LSGCRGKNGNEGEKQHVRQQGIGLVLPPEVKHFEQNGVGGMPPVTVASAGPQIGGEREKGRISGQQRCGGGDFREVSRLIGLAEFLFQVQFELAEKTTANGKGFHDRPPAWQAIGLPQWLRYWTAASERRQKKRPSGIAGGPLAEKRQNGAWSLDQPKDSTGALLVEGKNNLLRMRQEIPLGESEISALDDGVAALQSVLDRLANVPTPAGPTPIQLRGESLVQIQLEASNG
jgi:hypothetical protein